MAGFHSFTIRRSRRTNGAAVVMALRRASTRYAREAPKNPSFRNHSCMPGMGYWYFQLLGNPYEIGQRRGFHLLHDPAAVDLKRHLTDSEFHRGLLVEQATGNQRQNFAFTGSQAAKASPQLAQFRPFQARSAILSY